MGMTNQLPIKRNRENDAAKVHLRASMRAPDFSLGVPQRSSRARILRERMITISVSYTCAIMWGHCDRRLQ